MSSKSSKLTATRFRTLLIVSVVILAIGIGVGYSFGIQLLQKYAVEVSHKKVDAAASSGNLQTLQQTDQQLTSYKDALEKADALKITSEFPEFRIIEEVQAVAEKNGVTISSYSYGSGGDGSTGASTDTSGATTPGVTGTTTPSTPAANSSGTISLTVNLSSPVNYKKLLQFIYDVEHHIPKMEMNGVSISPSSGSKDSVTVDALSIQMYINQ